MRSKEEIRRRYEKAAKAERREAKDIKYMLENNENDFLDLTIDRANLYQNEKNILAWVLGIK